MMKKFSSYQLVWASLFVLLFLITGCTTKENEDKIPVTTSSDEALQEYLKGRDLFEKLRAQDSRQFFANAIEKDQNFAMAYYYSALSNPTAKGFFEQRDKAVSLVDNVSEGERLFILAFNEGVNGNAQKQKEYLTTLVELYPNDERVHNQFGTFYFGQQDYKMAVEHLKKASEIAPNWSASYNMIGYSYRNLGDYAEAEKAFKKYIELIPHDPNPYDSYAELLMKEGKYEESIEQYKMALGVDPHFAASHIGIATNYNYMGRYDEAREECQKFYKMARNEGEKRAALFAMTVSYVDEGKIDEALKEMDKQYTMGEEINDAAAMSGDLNTMGNILFEAGRYDEAKEKYEKSLQVSESSNLSQEIKDLTKRLSLYNHARISLMKDNLADAKAKADEFGKKAEAANTTFQIWLSHELNGMIALKEKNYTKAVNEFNQANMQNPYTFYRLALAYQGNNNREEAKNQFEMSSNFNALNSMNQAFIRQKARQMVASM
jgi:tetratricopeptide (TPR) repeat protein